MRMHSLQRFRWRAMAAILWGIVAISPAWTACADDKTELFVRNCASCHGKDGKAQTSVGKRLGVKDLSQSVLTDAQIAQQIREGKQEIQSEVKMPAFKDKLSAEEIKSLVEVVKQFRKQTSQLP